MATPPRRFVRNGSDTFRIRETSDRDPSRPQVAKLSLIHISERRAERAHRLMSLELSRAMASHAPRLSLQGRLPEIERLLHLDPAFLERLAGHASTVAHTASAASVLGLSRHPDCVAAFGGVPSAGRSSEHLPAVRDVIYRLDLVTQQMDLEALAPPPPPSRPVAHRSGPEPASPEPPGGEGDAR